MTLPNHVFTKDACGQYTFIRPISSDELVGAAKTVLSQRAVVCDGQPFTSATYAKEYFQFQIGAAQREIFACAFLTSRHQLICFRKIFAGTINGCTIYPREVLKIALSVNAASVVVGHNHPSGDVTPSTSDIALTRRLKESLELIDVAVLDHVIVSYESTYSFAENCGL